jgi:L-ascorbate metabolism protein UlaG (beta-lactamase superfamily)
VADGRAGTGADLRVTWLGHSTVVLDLDGVRLLTDPLLHRHAGVLRRRGGQPAVSAWARPDAVLLSHLHHDHAELRSLRLLGAAPVLTGPASATWVTRKGFPGRGLEKGEWADVGVGSLVSVRLVEAVHHSRPMPHRPNEAHGHLVKGPSGVVWVAGDTALFPGMADLADLAGAAVDVAIVPVGGWGPRLSPGHLGPVQAAVACRRSGARWAVPVHWGTLHVPAGRAWPRGWMDAAGPRFQVALADEAPTCRALVLEVGGSTAIPPPGP